ncbi:MAG TPA: ATP-binding protein [Candidatus Limnocylindrales bacterium]|nr:ATP-binding protein [Candidatus Limnocylindrales bacterium]
MDDDRMGEAVNVTMGMQWASQKTPSQAIRLLMPVVLSGLLFFLDLHAPDSMMFGLPYLLVVVLAQATSGPLGAAIAAASAATLVLVAPFLSSGAAAPAIVDPAWMAAIGRTTVVAAIAMVVVFLRQRDSARAMLRQQVDVVESSAGQRSDQLRLVNAQLHREIAERRRAELRSGYLASIVESSADAIIGQSLSGTIVSWNAGATRVYGYTREQIIDRSSSMLIPPEHEAELVSLVARVAGGERVDEVESVRLRSDGTSFDVSASFSPILDDRGAIIGVSMIERDITRRMRAEEALQSLNVELEEKVRQRTEDLEIAVGELEAFSYSVSHDLRAPLRAMNGFVETLVEDVGERLSDDERELLGRIERAAGRMDHIINDLLTLSRAGNDRIEKEVVNLAEVARSIIEELRSVSPGRKIEWEIGNGLLAWGDAGLLRLVVQNLLGNAFKYTETRPEAHIAIGVHQRAGDSVSYFVRDNGIGFDPKQTGQLFRPFSRLHRSDQFEGSGIGLATVERIVRRHGGSVSAEGRLGEGATFLFRLPVPKRTQSALDDDVFVGGDDAAAPAVA